MGNCLFFSSTKTILWTRKR